MKIVSFPSRVNGWKVASGSTRQKQKLFVTTANRTSVPTSAMIVRSAFASSVVRIYIVAESENLIIFTAFKVVRSSGTTKRRRLIDTVCALI